MVAKYDPQDRKLNVNNKLIKKLPMQAWKDNSTLFLCGR